MAVGGGEKEAEKEENPESWQNLLCGSIPAPCNSLTLSAIKAGSRLGGEREGRAGRRAEAAAAAVKCQQIRA